MAFQTVADLDCSTTTALGGKNKEGKANPTTITGYFIGTRDVVSKKSKTGFAALHVLQTPKGNVGVWGKTNLDSKMKGVTPGNMVRITFTGMVETRNNPMYKYKVEVDADNSIEVATADTAASEETESYQASDASYDEVEETSLDAEEEALDEVPAPRATAPKKALATPDAARQAKVQELLNRSRNKSA